MEQNKQRRDKKLEFRKYMQELHIKGICQLIHQKYTAIGLSRKKQKQIETEEACVYNQIILGLWHQLK